MVKIKREALSLALHASKNTYPDEFIALLRDDDEGVITHILVLPRSTYGKGFSSVDLHMLPMFSHACGSFHSHPTPGNTPSRGDRLFFSRLGKVHIIAGYPYGEENARAYERDGKPIPLEVID
ncbi:MAG: Mov34/MPN/PAD-1 family protein [Candidatus Micrarchaeota archaeon]